MYQIKLLFIVVLVYTLSSCASISFTPKSKTLSTNNHRVTNNTIFDEDGNIIVKSGSNRDNRMGYYFNVKEKRCIQVFYSSGPDCIPPPFKTLQECESCKGQR